MLTIKHRLVLRKTGQSLSDRSLQIHTNLFKKITNFLNFRTSFKAGLVLFTKKQPSYFFKNSLKGVTFAFILSLYLFISPNSAVKANFSETVLPDPNTKVSRITSAVISEKAPTFIAPIYGYISTRFSRFHPGIDIPNRSGNPINATSDGEVIFANFVTSGHGNLVILKHNQGFESLYAHLSKISVVAGQKVTQGQVIGQVGSTGNSTGSHLHFELYQNGGPINPLDFFTP